MVATRRARFLAIAGLTLAAIMVILALPPIPQNQSYHKFADQRTLLGVSNFLDVISNVPFILVGLPGLIFLWQQRAAEAGAFVERRELWAYGVLFFGLALTGFGSAYYHLAPDSARLIWDRLPLTLVFMAILAATIAERISMTAGFRLLLPLVCLGVGSVIYWHWSELQGQGDLRPYILVQYYPMLAIPLIIYLFPSRYTRTSDLLMVVAVYVVAKIFELLDAKIFALGQIVSGHTLKHLAAAVATYWILRMVQKRHPRQAV